MPMSSNELKDFEELLKDVTWRKIVCDAQANLGVLIRQLLDVQKRNRDTLSGCSLEEDPVVVVSIAYCLTCKYHMPGRLTSLLFQ